MSKPTNNSNAVFHIPKTDEGREFVRLANKFINHPQFSFCREGHNRKGWTAMYIFRVWRQAEYSEACPHCGGDYLRRRTKRGWLITEVCVKCRDGTVTKSQWSKLRARERV